MAWFAAAAVFLGLASKIFPASARPSHFANLTPDRCKNLLLSFCPCSCWSHLASSSNLFQVCLCQAHVAQTRVARLFPVLDAVSPSRMSRKAPRGGAACACPTASFFATAGLTRASALVADAPSGRAKACFLLQFPALLASLRFLTNQTHTQ